MTREEFVARLLLLGYTKKPLSELRLDRYRLGNTNKVVYIHNEHEAQTVGPVVFGEIVSFEEALRTVLQWEDL